MGLSAIIKGAGAGVYTGSAWECGDDYGAGGFVLFFFFYGAIIVVAAEAGAVSPGAV